MTTKRKRRHQADTSWIELATEKKPKCAIPVLPRFQADLLNLTGNCQDPDGSKWLGKRIWPLQGSCNDPTQDNNNKNQKEEEVNGEESGNFTCTCQSPGSVECVNLHVAEERNRLKTELGPAFVEWEFDQIGEEALSEWSQTEENRFEEMLKRKQLGNQDVLVQPYWKYFRNKDRKSLVSYLFNVYIPRKFSRATRASCTDVFTDDEDDEDYDNTSNSQNLKSEKPEPSNNSRKRATPSESQKKGTKSEKAADERSKESSKSKTKNKYMAGFR